MDDEFVVGRSYRVLPGRMIEARLSGFKVLSLAEDEEFEVVKIDSDVVTVKQTLLVNDEYYTIISTAIHDVREVS